MKNLKTKFKSIFPLSLRDGLVTLGILALACLLCFALRSISTTDFHVPLIFVLAVLLVSLLTTGYACGSIASIAGIFAVNYAFTFPYFAFNFSMTGYPITFLCFFAVSIVTSTLISRMRQSEKLRMEGEKEKMRANLLRAISHDFRTPLTSIIGALNVIEENGDGISPEEKLTLLTDAKSDAEWLINMVENLLSITRIGEDGSDAEIHKEPQVVDEILGDAVIKFHRQYPDMDVDIRLPDVLLLVPMDATLIEQVIINLLVNSAIHGRTVTKIVLSAQRSGEQACFHVEDDGVGIDPLILDQLFKGGAVNRAHLAADDSNRNMGIGLSVCSTIVMAHGGSMKAENLPCGSGAAVSFSLPLGEPMI